MLLALFPKAVSTSRTDTTEQVKQQDDWSIQTDLRLFLLRNMEWTAPFLHLLDSLDGSRLRVSSAETLTPTLSPSKSTFVESNRLTDTPLGAQSLQVVCCRIDLERLARPCKLRRRRPRL
jgi:hypothetical protein